jgi:predicted PurR-regulated permease PerM
MSTRSGAAADAARGLAGRIRAAAANSRQLATGAAAPEEPLAGSLPPGGAGTPTPGPRLPVPEPLLRAAAWSLCLLLVAAVAYLTFRMAEALRLLVLPLIGALLLTALLQPLTARLKRAGLPPLAATWCTLLVAIAVLTGVGMLLVNRVRADYPKLLAQVQRTAREVQAYLAGPPFRLNNARLDQLSGQLLMYLERHRALVAGTVLTGGRYLLEVLAGIILTIFITFFLLKDGRRIWGWLISGFGPALRPRADRAGAAAWHALVSYVRGTTAVAAIHALVIGLALWLLGVPLLVPLVILVFLAAYVPLVGILVVGSLAIVVTLATKGWIAALILLAVLLAENQMEGHLLQPLVVGRIVRLHPLAIIIVLAVGGIVAGVPGAVVAVPVAAVITNAWPYLRGRRAGAAGAADAADAADANARAAGAAGADP